MDWFHTPVTVSSVGSCDFDRLISFLLVLCPAVEQGRYTSPFYSHQANLRITRSPLLHSRYDNLTIHTTVYRGSFSCILKRIIYNQKKKVFLPVYKRKITFFYSVSWVETSMHFFFFLLFSQLSTVNSDKEKHHFKNTNIHFFFIKKSTSFAEQNVSRHSNLKIRTGMYVEDSNYL